MIERAAYKPVRRSSRLAALITAIGVSLLLENGGMLAFGADPKFFPQIVAQQNIALGLGVTISNQQLIVIVVSLVLMMKPASPAVARSSPSSSACRCRAR